MKERGEREEERKKERRERGEEWKKERTKEKSMSTRS
jgi:hypothetical protein